jgi:hypothetical protein
METMTIYNLEDRFYDLLAQSQNPNLLKRIFVEEAERLELQAEGLQESTAQGGMDSDFVKLSVRIQKALINELPFLARLLLIMEEEQNGAPGGLEQRIKKATAPKKDLPKSKKVPYFLVKSDKMRDIYFSPLGEKVRDIQRALVQKAASIYTDMKSFMEISEVFRENQTGDTITESGLLSVKCMVALAGVRLTHFYSLTDQGGPLRYLLTDLNPVPAGELPSTEQAISWSKLIYGLARNGDINLSLFALEKLKTLPPFPQVLKEISSSTIEVILSIEKTRKSLYKRVKNRELEIQLLEDLETIAPSIYQYESAGIIPFIPKKRPYTLEWYTSKPGFMDVFRNIWSFFDEEYHIHYGMGDSPNKEMEWPFARKNPILDFHFDICTIADLLFSSHSDHPDLEEIEEPFLKIVNLIDFFVTNPYRLIVAGRLATIYAEFGQYEKSKFMHGVLVSIQSYSDIPESLTYGPYTMSDPDNSNYQAELFKKIKSETTMKLMDIFISGKYFTGKGSLRPKRAKTVKSILTKDSVSASESMKKEESDLFDRLYNKKPALVKVEALLEKGAVLDASKAFLAVRRIETVNIPHFLHTGVEVLRAFESDMDKILTESLIEFIFDRDFPGDHLKNYAAHSGVRILSHVLSLGILGAASRVYDYLCSLLSTPMHDNTSYFQCGMEYIMKEAAWLLDIEELG